jgi:hypothetical protein
LLYPIRLVAKGLQLVGACCGRFCSYLGLWRFSHLGLETQRQWSDLAIERTTPLLMGLYSLVTLFAHALASHGSFPLKQAAWYHKQMATFSDVLALVRGHFWGSFTFPTSPSDPDVVLVPRSILGQFAHAVCY